MPKNLPDHWLEPFVDIPPKHGNIKSLTLLSGWEVEYRKLSQFYSSSRTVLCDSITVYMYITDAREGDDFQCYATDIKSGKWFAMEELVLCLFEIRGASNYGQRSRGRSR